MRRNRFLVLVVASFALGGPALAHAQATGSGTSASSPATGEDDPHGMSAMRMENLSDEQARSHFRIGQTLYGEGRYHEAGEEFERAYTLSHRPVLNYNAYLAYRDAGDLEDASRTLERYLAESPNAEDREVLERRLRAMQSSVDRQRMEAAEAEAERRRLETEREALAAEATRRANAERAEAEREHERRRRARGPLMVVVAGGGLLVGSGVSALVTHSRSNSADSTCPDGYCPVTEDASAVQDSVRRPAIATDVLLGLGAATTITGLVLYVVRRHGADEPPPVSAGCGPTGCDAHLRLHF